MAGWKEKLADVSLVEAVLYGIVFFSILAVLDAVTPVDIFPVFQKWMTSLAGLAGDLLRALRGEPT